jgi:hypothetical protein
MREASSSKASLLINQASYGETFVKAKRLGGIA